MARTRRDSAHDAPRWAVVWPPPGPTIVLAEKGYSNTHCAESLHICRWLISCVFCVFARGCSARTLMLSRTHLSTCRLAMRCFVVRLIMARSVISVGF
eukprot:2106699-Prymnesium_polylepis.2